MSGHIAIVGAGVAGLTAATELAARGYAVELFEAASEIGGDAASHYAGGMLAPYCERESAEEPVIELGLEAADWWQQHTGLVQRKGSLVLALGRDRSELTRFAARTRNHELIGADEVAQLEPDLEGRFTRGLFFAGEAHINPRDAMRHLADKLTANGGSLHLGQKVQPEALPQSIVVDCRGWGAGAPDGPTNGLRGVKGEMAVLHAPDIVLNRPIRLVHPRFPLYIVPRADNHFMVGATMLESGERGRVTARAMLELLGAAYALHPAFAEAEVVETGTHVRPSYADNLPRIEQNGRIISINGLYRHGFLLGPAMARQTADLVAANLSEASHARRA
ncbi:MAG: FAD-dependent oxidoreductase [Pseudomonadota bacterium]